MEQAGEAVTVKKFQNLSFASKQMCAKFKWKQRSSKVKKNDKGQKRNKNEPI